MPWWLIAYAALLAVALLIGRGNYTSPWLCNMYLTPLDRYITDTLKPRRAAYPCKAEGLAKKYIKPAQVKRLKEVIRHESKRQSAARRGVPGGAPPIAGRGSHHDRV